MNRFDIAKGLTPEEPQKPSTVSDIVPKKKKPKESSLNGLYLHSGSDSTPIYVEDLSYTPTGSSIRVSLSFQITPEMLNALQNSMLYKGVSSYI